MSNEVKVTKSVTSGRQPPVAKPGSRKGIPNKITGEIRAMVGQAVTDLGGVDYFVRCANDKNTAAAFLSLVGKVMPLQIVGPGANGEHLISRVERLVIDAKQAARG